MVDIYEKIADSFIGSSEAIKDLFPKPKPSPTTQYPFAEYLKGQIPQKEEEEEEEEEYKEPWTKIVPWFPKVGEAKPISPGVRMTPEGAVWQEGIPFPVGNMDAETGEFKSSAWIKAVKGLEYILYPFTEYGMGRRELGQPAFLPTYKNLMAEYYTPEAIEARKIEGGKYKEYQELPFLEQLKYEAPAWISASLGGLTATGARAALAPAARAPAAAVRVPAQVARGALAPVAAVEAVPGAVLKYGLVIPVTKGIPAASRKLLQVALDQGLDRWIAVQGRLNPAGRPRWQNWILTNRSGLIEKATKNMLRRQAERKGAKYAANTAASDTVKEVEPLLLQAGGVRPAVAPPTKPAVRPEVPVAEPGMPEAGLQPSMLEEVAAREVRPPTAGIVTQAQMDDYLKLQEVVAEVKPEAIPDVLSEAITNANSEIASLQIELAKPRVSPEWGNKAAVRGAIAQNQAEIEIAKALAYGQSVGGGPAGFEAAMLSIKSDITGIETELGNRSMPYHGGAPASAYRDPTPSLDAQLLTLRNFVEQVELGMKTPPEAVTPPVVEGVKPLGAGDIASGWQKTRHGRMIYKGDLSLENAKDVFVYEKITNAPSYPKLLVAYKRHLASLYRAGDPWMSERIQEIELQPWELLTAHAGVMNAKSTRAITLRNLSDAVFEETGLPQMAEGKFRGEAGLDWDKVKTPAVKPTATVEEVTAISEVDKIIPKVTPPVVEEVKAEGMGAIEETPTFEGSGFRVDIENIGIPRDATAADIIRFEEKELGNVLGVSPELMRELENYSAKDLIWVTKEKKDAEHYLSEGMTKKDISVVPSVKGGRIIAVDEEGGYLVLRGFKPELVGRVVPERIKPPPPTPPPTPPVTPPPTVPPGKMMADLQDFSEMAEIAFKPDAWRNIANLPVARSVMNVFGPAATANTPAAQAMVGRAMLRHEGQQKAQGVISHLNRLGTQDSVLGKLDEKGLIAEGPLKGISVNTIRTYPGRYAGKMTPAQKRWIEQADIIEQEKLDFLKRNGIEVNELGFDEGGHYAGRRVFARVKVTQGEPEVLEAAYVGTGPGRPGAKIASEKHRVFETEEEAIETGFRYLPEDEALYLNVSGAYNRVADKQMADWLLLRVPWRTTGAPEELKLASYAAKQKLNRGKSLRASLNRAVRGERVPDSTINSIARAHPEQAERLRALIPRIQAKQTTAPEVQALKREADDLIKSSQLEWYKAKSATARAREIAMVPAYGEAAIPAPAFAGKILTGPEAKETAKVIMESLSPGFNKALGAVNKVNAIARFFMLAGDLSPMTIQLLFFMGSYTKIYGQAGGGMIKAIFDSEFHANYLAKHNATVQKSRNLIITKSGATEFTEAMARGGYLSTDRKLWPAEEKLIKKTPLIAPRSLAKVGATVLRPFQRGFEAALDVAGIELREALDYMCTTPERTAGVEQFINEFRGVTSSARIGVSVRERQAETAAILAPRYNRAIAAWLFDLGRGNIRGGLARKSLAKGVAALVALAIAISYARGEETEEVLEHLNPTSPMFMTWQVAGQKVGPGSKIRSVIKLFGQSAKDPEKLFELSMDNPALRWIRGNLSPVISTGYDLLTGRDYIGDPSRDGMLSFSETVAENFMPIWTQTFLLEGGTLGERAVRGATEFLGMRGYPDPWGKLEGMKEEAAQAKYSKPYKELNRLQQKEIDQRPGIKELQEQSEAESARRATGFRGEVDDFFAEGDRIEKYRSEKLWEIHNQMIQGSITQGDANSAYWSLGTEISGMYEARDIDPHYDKVREYLEERATEKEKEQEGKEIYPGDKAYYEYQNLFEQADAEGWTSEVISQRIEMLWRKYPGAEEYVTQLQEVGKDWPPSYLLYRRKRGGQSSGTSLSESMLRGVAAYKAAGGVAPQAVSPVAPEAVTKWQAVRADLNVAMLRGLEGLWYRGESLPPQVEAQLKAVHQRHSFGQPNFNAWAKQTLRQIFENSIMGK